LSKKEYVSVAGKYIIGDFDGQGGEKNKGGERGAKNTKGAKVLND